MRFFVASLATVSALLCCLPALAEVRAFEGRISILLPEFGEREVGSGVGVADVNPGVGLETVSLEGPIVGITSIPITDPTAVPLTSIRVDASVPSGLLHIDPFAGTFSQPAITGAAIPIPGAVRLCMIISPLPPCFEGLSIPLTTGSGAAGVGIGGILTVGGAATLRISVYGVPFTVNTATVMALTEGGAIGTLFSVGTLHGPLSFTSTAGLTVNGIGGLLSVVTPLRVVSSQTLAGANDFPGFLRLEIQLLPEPGLLLLLAAGAAGLLALGRARIRRHATRPPRRS